jgi:hypothetical protein
MEVFAPNQVQKPSDQRKRRRRLLAKPHQSRQARVSYQIHQSTEIVVIITTTLSEWTFQICLLRGGLKWQAFKAHFHLQKAAMRRVLNVQRRWGLIDRVFLFMVSVIC